MRDIWNIELVLTLKSRHRHKFKWTKSFIIRIFAHSFFISSLLHTFELPYKYSILSMEIAPNISTCKWSCRNARNTCLFALTLQRLMIYSAFKSSFQQKWKYVNFLTDKFSDDNSIDLLLQCVANCVCTHFFRASNIHWDARVIAD